MIKIGKLDTAINIFDILALIFLEIKDDMSAINLDLYHEDSLVDLRDFVNRYMCNDINDTTALIDYLIYYEHTKGFDFCELYELIRLIDEGLSDVDIMNYGLDQLNGYKGLNLNYKQTGIYILPKMKKSIINNYNKDLMSKIGYTFRNRRIIKNEIFDLKNIIILTEEDLHGYSISLHRIRIEKGFYEKINKKGHLDICMIPFCSFDYQQWLDPVYTEKTFWTKQKENESYEERYIETLLKALDKDNDIIMFPEMVFTEHLNDKIKKILRSKKCKNPKIIICGSSSHDHNNICYVYDMRGNLICKQPKQTPFFVDNRFESLKNDKTIHILDIKGVGRIVFFICKDMINYELFHLIGLLQTDLILLPAFTSSLDIKSTGEQISREFNCITIMVNCCSAYHEKDNRKNKYIGYITAPAILKGERRFHLNLIKQDKKCSACDNQCMMMTIKISTRKTKLVREESKENIYTVEIVV